MRIWVLGAATAVFVALAAAAPGGEAEPRAGALRGPEPAAFAGPDGRRALSGPWWVSRRPGRRGRQVTLPHVPGARALTMRGFEGSVAWFSTTLRVPATGDYAVRFESVGHRATVRIDGRVVARHTGAQLAFEVRRRLSAGAHRLVVRADWRDPDAMRAAGWHRTWFNFGGIGREVTIRRLAASELDAAGIVTRLAGRAAVVDVTVRVRNRTRARTLAVRGRLGAAPLRFPPLRFGPGEAAWVRTRVRIARPDLWRPGHPALVALRLAVPGEAGYRARVGLRAIGWRDGRLTLNGAPLRLRGVALHEDAPGRGDGLRLAEMDAIVARLRRLGANATRSQHPLDPALLERLDRAGILVWQGIGPVDHPGDFESPLRPALRRARVAILQARAHPSVAVWSLANEVRAHGAPGGRQAAYVRRAAAAAHALDPGRPVAVDVWGKHLPPTAGPLYAGLDAVGVTNYEGWYHGLYAPGPVVGRRIRAFVGRLHALFARKVVVISEFGAEGDARNAPDAPGGLRFQARVLARHMRAYRDDPRLDGTLAWVLQDFAIRPNFLGGSVRNAAPDIRLRRGLNQKGLYTYGGRPKPAAAALRALWR